MKKFVSLGLVLSCGILLAACGSGEDNKSSKESSKTTATSSQTKESSTVQSSKKETEGDFVSSANDASFDGTTLKGNSYTVKITDHKVLQPGEKGNEYGDKPVIAFWYDTLVNPNYDNSTPIDPSTAWMMNFKAVQDNDPNAINKLNVGSLPDDRYLDSQMAQIKPGGTVSNAVAYELTDTETPVVLSAESILGKEFGKAEFAVK